VKQVTVYSAPNSSSESIGVLKKGEALEIAGGKGQYYLVRLEDRLGYIQRGQVKISARVRSEALPEAICPNLALETNIPIIYSNWLRLTGEINAEKPLDTLYAYIWDERQFQVEQAYYRELDIPSAAISASSLKNFLSLGSVKGGRKTLVIQGSANGETFVLFRSSVYICGDNREPASVTGQCTVSHSQLTDNNISTAVLFTKQRKSVSVDIPAAAQAALMTLEWKVIPDSFTVELYGAEQKLLSTETYATGFYADWISLPSEARRAVITPNGGEETALSSLRVYSETYSRHAVQQWEPTPDKLDLLLISTHQDDELLFFGGAIPYYACREDVRMDVLYMADCGRLRMREALNGLWTAGLRNYPIFLDLPDQYTNSLKEAASIWKKYDPQLRLVRAYRQYRPEVVLFQDFKGEYGHGQHQYTAQLPPRLSPWQPIPITIRSLSRPMGFGRSKKPMCTCTAKIRSAWTGIRSLWGMIPRSRPCSWQRKRTTSIVPSVPLSAWSITASCMIIRSSACITPPWVRTWRKTILWKTSNKNVPYKTMGRHHAGPWFCFRCYSVFRPRLNLKPQHSIQARTPKKRIMTE
jgi:LmbE family N-acetylglucosaminyl deacetylase